MTNKVYQVLNIAGCGAAELLALSELNQAKPSQGQAGNQWLIQSHDEEGLNIHYNLCLVQPRGQEFHLSLPWLTQDVCPTCQGQGVVYRWNHDRANYEATKCDDCCGRGLSGYDSEIIITVSDGWGGEEVIRKHQTGRLNVRLGLRGDLILNVTWVEELVQNALLPVVTRNQGWELNCGQVPLPGLQ